MEALEIGRDGDLQETSNSDLQEESIYFSSSPVTSIRESKRILPETEISW